MSRVIFLDIDGPVIPPRTLFAQHIAKNLNTPPNGLAAKFASSIENCTWAPDPVAVLFIQHLAQETNAKIVISSTWRGHGKEDFTKSFLEFGFDPSYLHEDWRTGRTLENRTMEIQEWLDRHPEIESFVTIDDELLDFDTHIQVCPENGFLVDNYNQAYMALTGDKEPYFASNFFITAMPEFHGPQRIPDQDTSFKRSTERLNTRRKERTIKFQ